MNQDPTKSLGERLCDAFQAARPASGWMDRLTWDDFDDTGKATYERAAVAFAATLSDAPSEPVGAVNGELIKALERIVAGFEDEARDIARAALSRASAQKEAGNG